MGCSGQQESYTLYMLLQVIMVDGSEIVTFSQCVDDIPGSLDNGFLVTVNK